MKNQFLRLYLSVIYTFCATFFTIAQDNGIKFSFSHPNGILTYNNSTSGSISILPGGADDQLASFAAPSVWGGFIFGSVWYPQNSTTFYVSSNGWLCITKPGDSIPPSSLPLNSLSSNPYHIIAPLWDDLKVHPNGEVTYKIVGGPTTRAIIIEWRGMCWDHNGIDSAISFQAILSDNMNLSIANRNSIKFSYKRNGSDSAYINNSSGGASIGFSGYCSNDVYAFSSVAGQPDKSFPEVSTISTKPLDSELFRFATVIHANDDCASAQLIPFNPAIPLNSTAGSTINSTQSGSLPVCGAATTVSDVWYTFIKPAGVTNFEIFTDSLDCRGANYATGIEIYNLCNGVPLACDFGSAGPSGTNALSYLNIVNQQCTAQQYWVRVFSSDTSYRGYFRFNIRPSGRNCTYANDITNCGIPYSTTVNFITCGFGNDYDSTNSEPHSPYSSGEDYVFKYTPPISTCVNFSLINNTQYESSAMLIFLGCPYVGTCIGHVKGSAGTTINFKNVSLIAGLTYYFVVDNDTTGGQNCISFIFSATLSTALPSTNDVCSSAISIPVANSTTCAGVFDYNNNCTSPTAAGTLPMPSCGSFTDGVTPDVWFTFSSTNTSIHNIKIDKGTAPAAQDLALAIYTGNCGAMTLVNCDDNSNGAMPSLSVVPPGAGTTYYVRVWSNNASQTGNFRICVTNGCTAANDFCTGVIPLTIGHFEQGDNSCASGINEPLADTSASCWTNSGGDVQLNTVWYSFVATDNSMKIRIHLISLFDSQMALYSSTNGCNGIFTQLFCNDNIQSPCFVSTDRLSQITATGLTVGRTYFIRVDGVNANTGTFEIIVVPGLSTFPPVFSQDCPLAIPICNDSTIFVGPNVYQGGGNTCDVLPWGSTCLANGEVNSVFYQFSVAGTGIGNHVQFTITPNGIGNCDFEIWCIDSAFGAGDQIPAVPNFCNQLSNFLAFPATVCNFSTARITGCNANSGTIPIPGYFMAGLWAPGISPAIYVPNGMTATFLLLVNSDNNANGFILDWMGTPITGTPPSLLWYNSNNSTWNDSTNWVSDGCGVAVGNVPDCNNQIPARILAGGTMPVFTVNTTVPDIIIDNGATVTINPGITLQVCGNFINNGSVICGAGSTLRFVGNRNTNISGYFHPNNDNFWNFEVAKDSGAVVGLASDIVIRGNESIYSGILYNGGHSTSVGKNFYNYNGNSSFTGFGNGAAIGSLRFTSSNSLPQHFRNDGSPLTLNNVYMDQAVSGSLILDTNSTSDLQIGVSGHLTLTKGKIITNSSREVNIENNSDVACLAGNTLSYVEGNLRRAIDTIAANYDFPIGDSAKGYQRFLVQYSTAPSAQYNILAKFRQWQGLPIAPSDSECVGNGYNALPVLDNGYWTLDVSDTSGLGIYNANAFPRLVTNSVGSCYSVMKSPSNNGQGPWSMQGLVTITSSSAQVVRDSLNSFSDFAVVQDFGILSGVEDDALNSNESIFRLFVFPNPASIKITLSFNSAIPQSFFFSIKDITGRFIVTKNINADNAVNSFDVNIHDIAKGIYFLTLENKNLKAIEKLIVQ